MPSGRTISAISWKTYDTTDGCGSTSATTTTQGGIVCLNVTGSGFQSTDSLLASILTRADHQPGQVAVGGIGLEYVSSTTMSGRWVAQRLMGHLDASNNSVYEVAVVGYENSPTASLTVGPRATATTGSGARTTPDSVQKLIDQLQHLGVSLSNAQAIVNTLYAVYGGSYSSKSAFAEGLPEGSDPGRVRR